MKRLLSIIICILMVFLIAGCNKEDSGRSEYSLLGDYEKSESVPEYYFVSGEYTMPENFEGYSKGAMDFAFSLLSAASEDGENSVISPLSVSNVLALILNGADTATEKEIRQTIAGVDTDTINLCNHYINSRLNTFSGEEGGFTIADSLWLDDSFDVMAAFLQNAVNYYNSEVMRIDLQDKETLSEINDWIKDYTDDEISDVINNIDENALMMLVNAVLMQDEWATVYEEEQLDKGVFHGSKGDTEATFMISMEHYISSSYAQGFIKDFKNLPLKFVALLPEGDVSAEEFVENFTSARWQELLASQQATAFCSAFLPEFKIDFDAELSDALKNMGITRAFDNSKADFSQLSNMSKPFVSEVNHKAFIEIGPQGAKAGAATVSEMKGSAALSDVKEVKLNKPFVFVICDNESGIPVLTGVVNNVSK